MITKETVAIVYTDNGPRGACGQSCSITSSWTHVYLFSSVHEAREWLKTAPVMSHRNRPRWILAHADKWLHGTVETVEWVK